MSSISGLGLGGAHYRIPLNAGASGDHPQGADGADVAEATAATSAEMLALQIQIEVLKKANELRKTILDLYA